MLFAGTLTHSNKVQRENTAIKENVHADFIYELSPKMKGKFRIEVKVCVSGTFYTICTCRWVSTNNPTCKDQNNESTCDVESSTLRLSLLVRRTYSEVLWDFLEQSSTPVLLKHIELQVICKFRFRTYHFLSKTALHGKYVCNWLSMSILISVNAQREENNDQNIELVLFINKIYIYI